MNLLTILILIYTTTYGSLNNTYNNNCDGHDGVYAPQTTRIGYTTKYGTTFKNSTCPSTIVYSSGAVNIYETNVYNSVKSQGPRKSKERPFSGNILEDIKDYARMNGIVGLGYDANWPGYVDEDFWESFLHDYPEYEEYARSWFESQGRKFPTDPDDPYGTPVGEVPVMWVVSLSLAYIGYTIFNNYNDRGKNT